MRDRFGDEIEPIEEKLPAEITAPEEEPDEEPEGPPDEYMNAHCECCDENGVRLNGLGRCDHIDYAIIARRHVTRIRAMLRKEIL